MNRKDIVIGLLIALLAFSLSPLASSLPDGLEKVAYDYGFVAKGELGSILKSPIPDYVFPGLRNDKLAIAISGFLGTVIIFVAGYTLAFFLKKRKD